MKFSVGDMAVHPVRGVGEVIRIEEKNIGGAKARYYIFQLAGASATMMVPVDGVERAGVRDVISKKEATKVLSELKKDEVAVTSQPWTRRVREYTEKLESGKPIEVARVLRDISRLRDEKELSFGERGLLEKARELLVNELMLAKDTTREKILKDFEKALGAPV